MIARNFYELGMNLFYAQTDICGTSSPDYFEKEFELIQAITAMYYHAFCEPFSLGRLANCTVSCLGFWYFDRLGGRILSEGAGLYAMLPLKCSIVLTYSRKILPDTFSLFLTTMETYYLFCYLSDLVGWGKRCFGTLGGAGGLLAKVPSVVVATLPVIPRVDPLIDRGR